MSGRELSLNNVQTVQRQEPRTRQDENTEKPNAYKIHLILDRIESAVGHLLGAFSSSIRTFRHFLLSPTTIN